MGTKKWGLILKNLKLDVVNYHIDKAIMSIDSFLRKGYGRDDRREVVSG